MAAGEVDPAPWDYNELQRCLTNERLSSYFADTDGSLEHVFELYEWNMAASAAVMEMTSMVEVIVRNALDSALTGWASTRAPGTSWLDLADLDDRGREDVAKARNRATRWRKVPEVHGKVIAELSLGFWRFLVESRYYTSLWVPAAYRAFPHGPEDRRTRQEAVVERMKQLMVVRNRAAHHEPIHRRALDNDLRAATDLSTWVSRDAGAWLAEKNSLRELIARHPAPKNSRQSHD